MFEKIFSNLQVLCNYVLFCCKYIILNQLFVHITIKTPFNVKESTTSSP